MQPKDILRQWRSMKLLAGLLPALILSTGCATNLISQPPSSSQAQVAQSSTNVTYAGTGGVTLAGTLLIPAHKQGQQVPGVVIVAGSGPTDRNGNTVGSNEKSNMYEQFANDLAQHGIASLRYDKRGIGESTPAPQPKDPKHPTAAEITALQQFQAWNNYPDDAAASLRYLQSQPAIDSKRTALLGHSEGTMISEIVATSSYSGLKPPAALVLSGAPGRTIDVLLREQIDNSLRQLRVRPAVESYVLQQYDAIIAGIRQTGQIPQRPLLNVELDTQVPLAIRESFAELFNITLNQFWAGELQVVPTTLISEYQGPVLILQGTRDTHVFANQDTPLMNAALAQRPHDDHYTLIVPGASHYLKPVTASDPEGITGPIEPQVLSTLSSWLNQKLR